MQSIMDTCILIVVFTLVVCVLQILFLYVIERSRNLAKSRFNGNRQGGDEQSRREGIPRRRRRGRRQPVEQEEWHTFGKLDFLRHLVNVGCCIVVVVVVVVDTIVCLVRFALFCLKLVKEFVLNSRVSALLHFFHINKLQKCRGLLHYRSESKWQNVIKKKCKVFQFLGNFYIQLQNLLTLKGLLHWA